MKAFQTNLKGKIKLSQLTYFRYLASTKAAVEDSQSFLFSLVKPSGGDPIRIVRKPGASGGIRCCKDWGPSFGTERFYDLQIWHTGGKSNLELGYGFMCPANADKEKYFTSKAPFGIDEMEVFQVEIQTGLQNLHSIYCLSISLTYRSVDPIYSAIKNKTFLALTVGACYSCQQIVGESRSYCFAVSVHMTLLRVTSLY